jgi:L-threonylcarbamoyladenylate synthase
VDVTGARPRILRPGGVARQRIEELIGEVDTHSGAAATGEPMSSPGQGERHYAPLTPAFRFDADQAVGVTAWCDKNPDRRAVIVVLEGSPAAQSIRATDPHRLQLMPADATRYAAQMYSVMRVCDESKMSAIWLEYPPDLPEWAAVRDRIARATRAM